MLPTIAITQQYQRFWIITASLAPRIYSSSALEEAITEFQHLLRNVYSPRFLGEQADDSLHDLGLPQPAISPADVEALRAAYQDACSQKYPLPKNLGLANGCSPL